MPRVRIITENGDNEATITRTSYGDDLDPLLDEAVAAVRRAWKHPTRQGDPVTHPPVPRDLLLELCERLDHDPNRVAQIIINPNDVDVIYTHTVIDPRREGDDDE